MPLARKGCTRQQRARLPGGSPLFLPPHAGAHMPVIPVSCHASQAGLTASVDSGFVGGPCGHTTGLSHAACARHPTRRSHPPHLPSHGFCLVSCMTRSFPRRGSDIKAGPSCVGKCSTGRQCGAVWWNGRQWVRLLWEVPQEASLPPISGSLYGSWQGTRASGGSPRSCDCTSWDCTSCLRVVSL